MATSTPLLIAMVGLPRSGKSTIVVKLAQELGAPIVRRDAIRLALHGNRFLSDAEDMVRSISRYMINSLFLAGHQVVIADETNYSLKARAYIQNSALYRTEFYEVPTRPEVCIERAHLTGQSDLEPVIQAMWNRFEPLQAGESRYIVRAA